MLNYSFLLHIFGFLDTIFYVIKAKYEIVKIYVIKVKYKLLVSLN